MPAPLLPSCDTVGKSLPPASLSSSVNWTQSPAQPAHLLHSVVGGTEEVTAQPVKLCAPRRDVQSFLCCVPVSLWQRDHPSQQREIKWASPRGQLLPPCCWPSNTPVPSLPVCPCDQTVNWRQIGPMPLELQIFPPPQSPRACLLHSWQALGSCLSSSHLLWASQPEVFFDPTWDSCAPHEVGSQMAPLEEGRQKKAKPGLAKRAVSLHRPPDSGRNGLTHPKELP